MLISDIDELHQLPKEVQLARDQVAYLYANKYKPELAPSDSAQAVQRDWKLILDAIKVMLTDDTSMQKLSLEAFGRIMTILAGGITRRDRSISFEYCRIISDAAPRGGSRGQDMARIMERLIMRPEFLSKANHTIEAPIWQSWFYALLTKPSLMSAYPLQQKSDTSLVHTVYVLHMVKNLKFDHYDVDAKDLVRVVIAGIQTLNNLYDIGAALTVALVILKNQPQVFREHIRSLVDAAKKAYHAATPLPTRSSAATPGSTTSWETPVSVNTATVRAYKPGNADHCRTDSLEILALLPQHFDETTLRPFAEQVKAHIATVAMSDNIRNVRHAVRAANAAWDAIDA